MKRKVPVFKYDDSGFYVILILSIEQKVMELLKINPKMTRIEIAESLGTSDSTIKRALKNLEIKNLISILSE